MLLAEKAFRAIGPLAVGSCFAHGFQHFIGAGSDAGGTLQLIIGTIGAVLLLLWLIEGIAESRR